MSSLRSSVRPKSSKQKWGTVLHPEFGMGYQKMTAYEIDQTVNRLHCNKETRERVYDQKNQKEMDKNSVHEMVTKLVYLFKNTDMGLFLETSTKGTMLFPIT